ncbi:MAG: hypothetical protein KatS3mg076_1653 [Candidatus Binatia bacterium]|nr:MAG: hypothetical protein KatS3mg076_1653 [Candidatus Binatia bacterium]
MIALLSLFLSVLVAPTLLAAEWPEGYGKARFRMSIQEFEKAYPEARRLTAPPPRKESAEGHDHEGELGLVVYGLEGQSLDELSPCDLQFRFAWNQLYEIDFDCGRDPGILAYLENRFGKIRKRQGMGEYWYGEKTVVSLNPRSYTFAFVDRELGTAVTNQLLAEILQGRAGSPGEKKEPAAP